MGSLGMWGALAPSDLAPKPGMGALGLHPSLRVTSALSPAEAPSPMPPLAPVAQWQTLDTQVWQNS